MNRLTVCAAALLACGGAPTVGDEAPAFTLVDTNPASVTFGEATGQGAISAHVSLWYFGHAN